MTIETRGKIAADVAAHLKKLGIDAPRAVASGNEWEPGGGGSISVHTPITNEVLCELPLATVSQLDGAIEAADRAFREWRMVPAPVRGELVRRISLGLREKKRELAYLVTAECGKIYQEALGEVQEMIDIADFAVGLSRQLYGLTISSERPSHRLAEQWHPLGPIGVISAFNFPVAVWAWNAMLALVCGDPVVWKPSEKTPLTAMACHQIGMEAIRAVPEADPNLLQLVVGDGNIGNALASDSRLPLISATGSIPMGRSVAKAVAARLGRSLLELGGNNASIVTESADMELAIRAVAFSAVGTCGQRCTSLRRLILHESIADTFRDRLLSIYETLSVGNPLDPPTLIGPLIDQAAYDNMQSALQAAAEQGGIVHGGTRCQLEGLPGFYVHPALVEIEHDAEVVQQETFAPIMYLLRYRDFEEAVRIQNSVPQGLSSSIFTSDMRQAEFFCSAAGSDCGIANVNIGTSGAEIGGAFGGEKETGGGRESGSDSWKAYMRRCTNTINYSDELPLAQGIQFDI